MRKKWVQPEASQNPPNTEGEAADTFHRPQAVDGRLTRKELIVDRTRYRNSDNGDFAQVSSSPPVEGLPSGKLRQHSACPRTAHLQAMADEADGWTDLYHAAQVDVQEHPAVVAVLVMMADAGRLDDDTAAWVLSRSEAEARARSPQLPPPLPDVPDDAAEALERAALHLLALRRSRAALDREAARQEELRQAVAAEHAALTVNREVVNFVAALPVRIEGASDDELDALRARCVGLSADARRIFAAEWGSWIGNARAVQRNRRGVPPSSSC